jgi:pimeloyl-ACP methyl ester carboxylesterase
MPARLMSRFIDHGGARVFVEAWGDAQAPVLLCLHGLGGGTHFFGALGALGVPLGRAGQCRIIAIDQPGSGLSPLSGAFSFDAVADLVVNLARGEELNAGGQPVYLLGHSMGTILALEVIRRAPDLAAALIVVGGLPEALPGARTRIRDRVEMIRRREPTRRERTLGPGLAGLGLAGLGADVVAANFSRRSQAERPELTALFAKLFDRQDPIAYASTADALATWTARDLPPLDRVSCLVITGEEDRYAPPDAIRAFARTLPARTRVEIMRDCGHLPFLEQPAAFAGLVSSFLAALHQSVGVE